MSRVLLRVMVVFSLVGVPLVGFAQKSIEIEKGKTDLLKDAGLSQPFTVFDQLLYSLRKEAEAKAKYFRPENHDFRLSLSDWTPRASVEYDRSLQRVEVSFDVTVIGMNEPWREVCKKHVVEMANFLMVLIPRRKQVNALLPHGEQVPPSMFQRWVRVAASRYLGAMARSDRVAVSSLRDFFYSIVVSGDFSVTDVKDTRLRYFRQCALDTRSERMSYYAHKY